MMTMLQSYMSSFYLTRTKIGYAKNIIKLYYKTCTLQIYYLFCHRQLKLCEGSMLNGHNIEGLLKITVWKIKIMRQDVMYSVLSFDLIRICILPVGFIGYHECRNLKFQNAKDCIQGEGQKYKTPSN